MHRSAYLLAVSLLACNDAPPRDDASGGSTGGTTSATVPTSTDVVPTSAGTDTSAGTGTATGTGTDSGSETGGSSTTGGGGSCPDTQPPGYMGTIDDACAAEPQTGTFNPVVEWTKPTYALAPDSANSFTTPVVTSLTDDNMDGAIDDLDIPDIVVITLIGAFDAEAPGTLRALSGDGSSELWAIADQQVYSETIPAAGDLDGDGVVEVVATTVDHRVICFANDSTVKWTSMPLAAEEIRADAIAISDMDHDGQPELIIGRVILNGEDGSVQGIGGQGRGSAFNSVGRHFSTSFAIDADADGTEEVVVGNAMYGPDGATLWQNGQVDGFVAAADFDADGQAEVVVSGFGRARLQDGDGTVLWDILVPDAMDGGGPATIADFNGDGEPEIGIAGKQSYVLLDGDGIVLWKNPVTDISSGFTGSSVYDFEGDGVADVVYADEGTLWVFSGVDGAVKLAFTDHGSGTAIEYPVIADVDGDGETEIVFVHNNIVNPKMFTGITVVGDADHSWTPARRTWNQYAYFITNVEDDGGIPQDAALNWTLYNNFRAGDPSPPDGSKSPDLVLEGIKCEGFCTDEQVFWVHLGNEGASPLTAGATLELYGVKDAVETLLDSQVFVEVLPPGEFTDGIKFAVDPFGYDQFIVRALANEEECKPDNNELTFDPPFCMPPG
jgi:hypothetical protein